ncbi:c-type cytochrome [Methylotetracoccus oryzae]|uniref:c-type cytochrome n=1 Tax=Methylotetracoccus oryzae TaxID=1919059 RepID=UPI0011192B0D|nr:cytochrome c [Methylotetracoccus oryzae]
MAANTVTGAGRNASKAAVAVASQRPVTGLRCTAQVFLARFLRLVATAALAALWVNGARALDLPAPEQLVRESGLVPQAIAVIEPHESRAGREVQASYTGLPLTPLLDRWFGSRWSAPEAEVLFTARDGYRSAIAAEALRKERTLLAFARSDGAPFVVDNAEQNQTAVPLGPYYLVWDNLNAPDRATRGTYGWAYQVVAIDVRSAQDDRALLPREAGAEIVQGFAHAKKHCLSCHAVRGVGGRKYPVDLGRAACRWDDAALKDWLREPSALRPGTTMPALNRELPAAERERVSDGIVRYLRAVEQEDGSCSTTVTPR